MYSITYKDIKQVFNSKGYKFFSKKNFDLNIFGIRVKTDTNSFDDLLGMAYIDDKGSENIKLWEGTTDAGSYWMQHPLNSDGTFILVPGQYLGMWGRGLHKGMPAFVQVGKAKGYRDNNKDTIHDMNPSTIQEGYFGINGHQSNPYTESYYVDKWSAGCQVWKRKKDHTEALALSDKEIYYNNNKTNTYTLLEISDFSKFNQLHGES